MKSPVLRRGSALTGVLLVATTSTAHGQMPQAGASALAMGSTLTASATGFLAVANNPAGLALVESPSFSLALPAVAFERGVGPVGLGDLADWEGRLVPAGVKERWLDRVSKAGSQGGYAELGATPVAMSVGTWGFQVSGTAGGHMQLGPDAVELLLYGNAGRTGEARDLHLSGSDLQAFALSTAALAYGYRATHRLHLGITGTFTVGHGLLTGWDAGSRLASDPVALELAFPLVMNRSGGGNVHRGSGVGVDVGALWREERFLLGATVKNLVQTFDWSLDGLDWIPGTALFDQQVSREDFDERPASEAPRSVRQRVADLTLRPVFAVGAAYNGFREWRIQADIVKRLSGGLVIGPEFRTAVGIEFRGLPRVPVRAHGALITDGVQLGGGASLILGSVHLSAAGAVRARDGRSATLAMFSLSFGTD